MFYNSILSTCYAWECGFKRNWDLQHVLEFFCCHYIHILKTITRSELQEKLRLATCIRLFSRHYIYYRLLQDHSFQRNSDLLHELDFSVEYSPHFQKRVKISYPFHGKSAKRSMNIWAWPTKNNLIWINEYNKFNKDSNLEYQILAGNTHVCVGGLGLEWVSL